MALLPTEGTAPLTVLLVEGSPIVRQALCRLVEARGHTVIATADTEEAWARLRDRGADIVIADWSTPDRAAGGLLARLRAREASDGLPYTGVILLAAPSGRTAVQAALEAGADACLVKPVDDAMVEPALLSTARVVRLERSLHGREELVRQQEELLREEVRRDPLTRMGNRIRLDEDLRRFRGRAQRYGHRAVAVMMAIDQYRRYNDALGRAAGDETLRRVAKAVRTTLRDADGAYRFSGERILLVLPEQDEDGGVICAERCRAAVAAMRLPHPRSDAAETVTLSAGVAELHGAGRDAIDEWMLRAEQALDAARATGGNVIVRGDHTRVAGGGEGQ
jgi:diguanylate cyclase (GGDEF)-like protein